MPRIAETFSGRCFERAISTMRRALGYKQALPNFWPCHFPIKDYETLDLFSIAFPHHHILVWHSDFGYYEGARSPHWEYQGNKYMSTETANDYLFCFGYAPEKDANVGHFAVGEPVVYAGTKLLLAVAVSLEPKSEYKYRYADQEE